VRRLLGHVVLAAAVVAFAVSCSAGSSSDDAQPGDGTSTTRPTIPDSAKEAILEALTADAMAEAGASGAIVGVWGPDGFEHVDAVGLATVEPTTPMDADMRFRIGSITAAFTCTVLLQLVDEGRVTLDDPVSGFVDFVPNGDANLAQLCSHTSGIPDYATDPEFVAELAANPTKVWSPGELYGIAFGRTPDFEPGEGWQYSATNLWLAGEVVQQITGQPVGDEIDQRILEPLRLRRTAYPDVDEGVLPDPHPEGYWAADPSAPARDVTVISPSSFGPAGAMTSKLSELSTLARALASGHLLRPTSHERRIDSVPIDRAGPDWLGYGIGVVTVGPLIGHHGEVPGFLSAMLHDPETATTIVVMLNNSTGGGQVALALAASMAAVVLPDRVPFTSEEATVALAEVDLGGVRAGEG
jgi:D-alanyl-D-alanine carboxypeptidase